MDAVTKKARQRLGVFTTFLATATGVTGFLGGAITEVGIPQARADSSPPSEYVTDVPLWQRLMDAWYTAADDAGLWVTSWASGADWGDYNLIEHGDSGVYTYPTGVNIDKFYSPGAIDVVEGHPPQGVAAWRRGVNLAGPDFGHRDAAFTNLNRGTLNDGTSLSFNFPTAGDIAVMALRRIRTIRLPVNWERIQPTLLGALDTTYLGYVTAVANACASNGVGCILEIHNYARYDYDVAGAKNTLVLRQGSGISLTDPSTDAAGSFGPEYLIDLWRRISNVFRTHTGVIGYELMNEPHDIRASSGSFSGTTLNDFNSGTQSWAGGIGVTVSASTTSPYEGSGILHGAGTADAGGLFTNFEMERGSVAGTGNVLRARVRLNGTPTGTWSGRLCWVDSGFSTHQGPAVTLTPGSWTEVLADFAADPIAGSAINLKLQVQCNAPAAGASINWDLDFLERGSISGSFTAVQAWEDITQQVLTDLRMRPDDITKRDTKTVLVAGMGWNVLSWNHPTAWLVEPVGNPGTHLYVTHHYFDSNSTGSDEGRGVYDVSSCRYADAQTYALSQGFTNDADTTNPTITVGASASLITSTGATIGWTTSENCDTRVEYGVTNSYFPLVYGTSTVRQTSLVSPHSVVLTGLASSTTYLVRVSSRDGAGNLVSGLTSFTTLASIIPPVVILPGSFAPIPVLQLALTTNPTATPTWTDVSDKLESFSFRRGRQDELADISAGTINFRLSNEDRAFDPLYTSGPYFGNLKRKRRGRLLATWNGGTYPLMHFYVRGFPLQRENYGNAYVDIMADDALAILASTEISASYGEERTDVRIGNTLASAGWAAASGWIMGSGLLGASTQLSPVGDASLDPGSSFMQTKVLTRTSALAHLQDVVRSENGMLFVSKSGAIVFHSRLRRIRIEATLGGLAVWGESYNTGEMPYTDVVINYDDRRLFNDIRVTREGGVEQQAIDATSQLQHYPVTLRRDIQVPTDTEANSAAVWLLDRYKDPPPRIESMMIDPHFFDDRIWNHFLGAELGDPYIIRNRPLGGGNVIEQASIIEQMEVEWRASDGQSAWAGNWSLSPVGTASTEWWILGEGLLGTSTKLTY